MSFCAARTASSSAADCFSPLGPASFRPVRRGRLRGPFTPDEKDGDVAVSGGGDDAVSGRLRATVFVLERGSLSCMVSRFLCCYRVDRHHEYIPGIMTPLNYISGVSIYANMFVRAAIKVTYRRSEGSRKAITAREVTVSCRGKRTGPKAGCGTRGRRWLPRFRQPNPPERSGAGGPCFDRKRSGRVFPFSRRWIGRRG